MKLDNINMTKNKIEPIIVNLQDLAFNENLPDNFIENAFGKNSLGIIIIKGIPNILKLRTDFFISGRKFIHLSEQIKEKYVNKESHYTIGWSYGKEMIPDFSKGSYYANPLIDEPTTDTELIKKYPSFYTPNIWPNEIPDFKKNFKELGELIYIVGLLVLNHCDKYLKSKIKLETLIQHNSICKGQFLHYYPIDKEDYWDYYSGCLTGLISDSELYIKDRNNNIVKVNIPENCVAYKIGEIIQKLTQDELIATSHCVKSSSSKNTLAIYTHLI